MSISMHRYRRRASAWLILLGVLFLAPGCSTRDHDNPLDPENPVTGGEPRWLEALSGDGLVDLNWSVRAYDDLSQIQVIETGSETLLWAGKRTNHSFTHHGLANGTDFRYRVDLKLAGGITIELPEEIATPGRTIPWALDFGSGNVVRMTPDGRGVRTRTLVPEAAGVRADPVSGEVLALGFFGGCIRLMDRNGEEIWVVEDLMRPSAALKTPQGWWVTDSGLGAVMLFDTDGQLLFEELSLIFPADIAPADSGAVWVADRLGPLVKMNVSNGIVVADTLDSPFAVCEAENGGVWVADRDANDILLLDAFGVELLRLRGYPEVAALAADPPTGGAWVADRSRREVLLLDADGTVLVAAGGFPSPSSISVSPEGQEIWVADPSLGRVVRLSRDGNRLVESRGVSSPTSVSVVFDPAAP